MVGKIRHARQKLHQEAVKLDVSLPLTHTFAIKAPFKPDLSQRDALKDNKQAATSFPSAVFAGTKITPEALVQTLKFEETPEVVIPAKRGQEEKKVRSKKEKMKERRDRWLSKISSIKQARERQVAQAKRQAMPVVGDMQPLADALPELCQLVGADAAPPSSTRRKNRKNRIPVKKRPEPSDFRLMKQSQKRRILEQESSRFGEAVKTLASTPDPLVSIGEQLRKRMRQEEEEQGPS